MHVLPPAPEKGRIKLDAGRGLSELPKTDPKPPRWLYHSVPNGLPRPLPLPVAFARGGTSPLWSCFSTFLGSAVSIALKGQSPSASAALPEAGVVSFSVPARHSQKADYAILHLEVKDAARYWVEVNHVANESSGGAIKVPVSRTGVYALALIRAPLLDQAIIKSRK